MEEQLAHWHQASVVAEETYRNRTLVVIRVSPQLEQAPWGMAQCTVRGQDLEGVFWLRRKGDARTIDGYLSPTLDDLYTFPAVAAGKDADWLSLLAFTKRAMDYNYKFPDALKVKYRKTELSKKIGIQRDTSDKEK